MHVAPIVQRFLAQHPRMRVQLLLLDRVVNLVEEGIDAGVRIGHLDDSSLVAQPVGAIRRVVVASPEFLARHGRPAHPRALASAPCLRFSGLDGVQWAFRDEGRPLQVAVQGPFECNLGAPMLEACAAGLGYARCLAYQAAPLLAAGRLEIVLDGFEVAPWPVHLVRPGARLLARRTRAFIDVLRPALQAALAGAPA